MVKDKISIIVPVYNTGKYLSGCLDSLVNQTYSNIEIIIINDGSTDNSLEVIKSYAIIDNRIKFFSQSNQGISAVRNLGLKECTGEYIMFVDSDDWIDLYTCERAVTEMKTRNLDVVMWAYVKEFGSVTKVNQYFGISEIIWDENNSLELWRRMIGPVREELQTPQALDSMITVWGKLYRYSSIKNKSFVDLQRVGTEDTLFNIEVFKNIKRVMYLPDSFSHYRKDNMDSLTHKYKFEKVYQWKELYRRIKKIIDNCNDPKAYYEALQNRMCLGLIGLGLNLVEDSSLTVQMQYSELKKIITMPHYKRALQKLDVSYFPLHWKLFFICLKCNFIVGVIILLNLMNYLRNK